MLQLMLRWKRKSPSASRFQKRHKALDLTHLEVAPRNEATRNPGITFLHGAVFVLLAGTNSIKLIAPAIAHALDLNFDNSSDLSQ